MRWIFLLLLFSLEARVSVLIPCHPSHFPLLEELLHAYAYQTTLPEEIVVSLSQVDQIDPLLIQAIESKNWPFALILLKTSQKCAAGTNRNSAARASSGDILICQDADDLPHPQRVEIVKYLFEHYPMHLLIHSYASPGQEFFPYEKEAVQLQLLNPEILNSGIPNGFGGYIPIHHGNVSLSRTLAQRLSWDGTFRAGEDLSFNIRAWHLYSRQCFASSLPLVLFRTHLSYFSNR
jgi:glycosyltransferase involved in cell wall biosynthesis